MTKACKEEVEKQLSVIDDLAKKSSYFIDCLLQDNGNNEELVKTGCGDFEYRTCVNINMTAQETWLLEHVKTSILREVEILKRTIGGVR